MRRLFVFGACAVALLAAACGGGDDGNGNGASADVDADVNSNAVRAAAAEVCDGRAAIDFAANYSAAMQDSASESYENLAENLRKAADAAPSEIKADFKLFADAMGPFLELFVSAEGNYMSLVQDPEFQEKAERVGQDDVQQASQRISDYFEEHCD